MIKRRTVLAALFGGLALLSSPVMAQVQLRISTAANEADPLAKALMAFKENVERDLRGQVAVSVHPMSSLFRQGTEIPALQRGNLEMSTMTTFEVEQQIPEYGVLSAGYMFRDYDHMKKVFAGPIGTEYADTIAAKMGIQIVDPVYLGTRQLNLAKARDVKAPQDLAGLKLRLPPGPAWVALGKGLGATPTPLGITEVYLALKNGAIDAQDNPLSMPRANNFHEVTEQLVLTSHLVQPVFFAFSKPFWDKLNSEQQEVVRKHARAAAEINDKARLQEESELLAFFEKAGLKISKPDLAPFRASVAKQYETDGIAQKWKPGLAQRIGDVR
jgi:tripartite ATP-independent transporter DctP family solute receptor